MQTDISAETINASPHDYYLVDVRETFEYQIAHIANAQSVPLSKFSKVLIEEIKTHASESKIVLYCKSGMRSAKAIEIINQFDPTFDVLSMDGGIVAWSEKGYPVLHDETAKRKLPIERQTQIIIGVLLLTMIALGHYVASIFFYAPLFIGCGLVFAGTTGWCGMAILISHMPWNTTRICKQNCANTKDI